MDKFLNQITCADCLDILPQIPSNSIDLIATDPPYNIGDSNKLTKSGNKIRTNKESWGEWDSMDEKEYLEWIERNIKEFYRVLKDSGSLVMFFDKFNITYLRDMGVKIGFHPVNFYALFKRNPLPNFRKNGFTSGFELGMIFNKNKSKKKWNFLKQNEMQNYFVYTIGQKETNHPTEKPVQAFKRLIQIFTDKGDIVLDPFAGSGTTLVAAKSLGRNFIGVEREEKYVNACKERLAQQFLDLPIKKTPKVQQDKELF